MELRFTFISFGVGWKRRAILRRLVKAEERKKTGKNAILRSWALRGRIVNRPVRLTAFASPGPAPSGGGRV